MPAVIFIDLTAVLKYILIKEMTSNGEIKKSHRELLPHK